MAQVVSAPDPLHARSPEEFIARLRALKDWSRLTCQELTARAHAAGDVLPPGAVAELLASATLPRAGLVAAFVRACGAGPAELTVWLAVRAELAVPAEPAVPARPTVREKPTVRGASGGGPAATTVRTTVPATVVVPFPARAERDDDGDTAPAEPPLTPQGLLALSSLRRSRAVSLLSVLALTATVVAIAVTTRGSHHGGPVTGRAQEGVRQQPGSGAASTSGAALLAPAAGAYRIRAAHSALCLSEREGERPAWVYQAPCQDVFPGYSLERLDGGYWRLATRHPEHGPGCSGIVGGRRTEGAFLADGDCDSRGPGEKFRLESVNRPTAGYRLRPVHTDFCLTVPGGTRDPWAHVVQLPCGEGESGQVFRFDPVASGAKS
ncbi:hypothetical protein [Streptomyces sp. NPDC048636]|uniref:RICIN domain-containing protein n=1 Tax=Streptomyces sp. NPDC048636 TaxID=3155762 RepID=UPI00341ECC13